MDMMNGFGTTLYGRSVVPDQPGRIATEWFCVFWIPIFPVRSYVVHNESHGGIPIFWSKSRYSLTPLDRLYRPHLKAWAVTWALPFAFVALLAIFSSF